MKKLDLYVLFGPPGSGKSEQALLLSEKMNLKYLSWGRIARDILNKENYYSEFKVDIEESNSNIGRAPEGLISSILNSEIEKTLNENKYRGIVIDTYPRYLDEAEELLSLIDKNNLKLKVSIIMNIYYPNIADKIINSLHCIVCNKKYSFFIKPKIKDICDVDGSLLENSYDDLDSKNLKNKYDLYIEESRKAIDIITKKSEISFAVDANQEPTLIFSEIISKLSKKENIYNTIYKKTGETNLPTKYGMFKLIGYQNRVNYEYHLALVKGDLEGKRHVPVRIHSSCITGDIFHSEKCDCFEQLSSSMSYIQDIDFGAVLYLFQEGRGINIINKIDAYRLQEDGYDTVEANEFLNFPNDLRDYSVVKTILNDLNVKTIDLITNNPLKMGEIQSLGVIVESRIPLIIESNKNNEFYLKTQKEKNGHQLDKAIGNSFIEIEIKFPLKKSFSDFIKEKIKLLDGIIYLGKKYENTLNFDNLSKDMYSQDARLRVREISRYKNDEKKKVEFCYKRRIKIGEFKEEEEIETSFEVDVSIFKNILIKMGYNFTDGYERYRDTYKYNNLKITLDEFPFGNILEIEGSPSDARVLCGILGLKIEDSYKLSCDDFYTDLCKKANINSKSYIAFDDNEMPKFL